MGIIPGQVSWSLVTEAAKAVRSTWEEVPSAGVSGAEPDVSSAGGWVGWDAAPLSAAGFWGSCAGFSGVSWAGFWEEVPCPPEGFALPAFLSAALSVAAGEAAVVALLGMPLLLFLQKRGLDPHLYAGK